MASAKPRIHSRRCLRGPALFLALWAVLLCSAPAPAADQTNPEGTTITKNPGLEATADGDRLTNNGTIKATATGAAYAIGMGDPDGRSTHTGLALTNNGSITASQTGTTHAYGMLSGASSTLINSGTITASATSNWGEAYGMFGGGNSTLTNSGIITAGTTGNKGNAYGMSGGDYSSLNNSGTITASGTTGMASGMLGGDYSTLANSGTISASATGNDGDAYGIYAGDGNSTLANSGTISASATGDNGDAHGMYTNRSNSSLTNSGAISASATGDNGYASGMSGDDYSTLSNYGLIEASATGDRGDASGMSGGDYSTLANSGAITAIATGNNGEAYGMNGGTNSHSTLANSGAISASATGDYGMAWGMYAGIGSNNSLTNSGAITAFATGDKGKAYGMEAFSNNSTLTNTGTVTAIATGNNGPARGMALYSGTAANYGLVSAIAANPANAWEVYGTSNDSRDTVNITNWATDLRDFTTYKFFGSLNGGKLDLTGSRLTLRPGAPERGFAWGREYAVASMIDGNHGQGAVASVTQEVPWARARLTGTDWTNQKISLHPNFTRKTSPGQLATSQGIAFALIQARGLERDIDGQRSQNSGTVPAAVADSGLAAFPTASAPDSGWSGFLTPYFSYVDNSDLDYDAKIAGFMAGATRRFSDRFAAGVHLGFSHADVSADLADQDGEALTGMLGLHAIYNLTPEWYLRGQLTGFISRASNDWQSGLPVYPLYTDADINSRGLYASLATGYDWRVNANNTITPEIGLSWLWSHQDSYSLNWEDRFGNHLDNYDLDYKAQDYNALYGTAMLRWRGSFDLAGGSFQPALGVGVRQTLTDGDVKSRVTASGSSFSTKATEDETTALAEAGFVWQRGITSVGLTYTGGYGEDQVVHTGWLTLKVEF